MAWRIIGAGAGTGISAKFLHKGGADLIFIYNSGRFRMQGLSSWVGHLPFGDANAIVMEMGEREVMPVVPDAAVIAGVCGFDPTRRMSHFLPKVVEAGFAGVINYPTVAVIDGRMRADLEAGNLGFDKEVEMIAIAHKLDLLTTAYVCTPDEAAAMVGAGVDMIVAHMGLTVGGSIGAQHAVAMQQAVDGVAAIAGRSRKARADVFVLAHGGPIAGPPRRGTAVRYDRHRRFCRRLQHGDGCRSRSHCAPIPPPSRNSASGRQADECAPLP